MWLLFGLGAIVFAVLNIAWTARGRDVKKVMFLSLALTTLTICALYSMAASRVAAEDWSALKDTVPTMSKAAWVCAIASFLVNSISLFKEKK